MQGRQKYKTSTKDSTTSQILLQQIQISLWQVKCCCDKYHLFVKDTDIVVANTKITVVNTKVVVENTKIVATNANIVVTNTDIILANTNIVVANVVDQAESGAAGCHNPLGHNQV